MKLKHLLENEIAERLEFQYEGTCVKSNIPAFYDVSTMATVIGNSQLLKPEFLEQTDIFYKAPKAMQSMLKSGKGVVLGFDHDLVWIYFNHNDKHYFFTADLGYKFKPDTKYYEPNELNRGTGDF